MFTFNFMRRKNLRSLENKSLAATMVRMIAGYRELFEKITRKENVYWNKRISI